MKTCENCGSDISETTKFCPDCGSPAPKGEKENVEGYKSNYILLIWPFVGVWLFFLGLIGVFLFVVISAIIVFIDSNKICIHKKELGLDPLTWVPVLWAILVLLVWILWYPVYLYKRREIFETGRELPRTKTTSGKIAIGVLAILFVIIVGTIGIGSSAPATPTLSSDYSTSHTAYSPTVHTTQISNPTAAYTRSYTPYPTTAYPTKIPTVSRDSGVTVRIIYSGSWAGAVGDLGSITSVEGFGNTDYPMIGNPQIVSANAQKKDDSNKKLTIQIIQDGNIVKQASTTASYGLAQVSAAL